jgi:hypothetical protein
MKDSQRIEKMMTKIKEFWQRYPDLRFGQMVLAIFNELDLFYVEDDVFERELDDLLQLMKKDEN